jgi:hypothetical protein
MKKPAILLLSLLASLGAAGSWAGDPKYPPLAEYMMPRDAEVALARSAAPASGTGR